MTVDEKRGIAYLPIGAPTIDRYGGDRHGANLFSDTLVGGECGRENISGTFRSPIMTSGISTWTRRPRCWR